MKRVPCCKDQSIQSVRLFGVTLIRVHNDRCTIVFIATRCDGRSRRAGRKCRPRCSSSGSSGVVVAFNGNPETVRNVHCDYCGHIQHVEGDWPQFDVAGASGQRPRS